jgi:hypothetical protein
MVRMSKVLFQMLVQSFNSSIKDIGNRVHSDRTATATKTKTKDKTDGLTGDYCHNTSDLCAAIMLGKAAGMAIISELGYRTVCVRMVLKMLNM